MIYKSIISLFKYMVIMICMFIKQIIAEILDFSKNIFINTKSNIKKNGADGLKNLFPNLLSLSKRHGSLGQKRCRPVRRRHLRRGHPLRRGCFRGVHAQAAHRDAQPVLLLPCRARGEFDEKRQEGGGGA